ncbi:hypothetical protein [Streptomyces angustmyceticus]|uniref:hypothetical protein n=1 Tax=Streptomyces angustmyceticus TaxID=285578 RepID=UPI00344B92DE
MNHHEQRLRSHQGILRPSLTTGQQGFHYCSLAASEDRAHLASLLDEPTPAGTARSADFPQGLLGARAAQHPEDAPERLLTDTFLHGLKARLCDDVDSLDSYLSPQMATMARKVAGALEVPQPPPA